MASSIPLKARNLLNNAMHCKAEYIYLGQYHMLQLIQVLKSRIVSVNETILL